jgi:uncharacterized phage infection (PIP) family protein YhgE
MNNITNGLSEAASKGVPYLEAYIRKMRSNLILMEDAKNQYIDLLDKAEDNLLQAKTLLPLINKEMEELNDKLAELAKGIKYTKYLGDTLPKVSLIAGFSDGRKPIATIEEIEAQLIEQREYTTRFVQDYNLRILNLNKAIAEGEDMLNRTKFMV